MKDAVTRDPVLAHPKDDEQYVLETDASGVAMGAVLSQRQPDGRMHPVAYMSETFSPVELNYDAHDRELLAIIWAFEQWHLRLEGTEIPVLVLTDHKNLEYWSTARSFNR